MRTKILKYFGMVVVLIIMVNLTSCEAVSYTHLTLPTTPYV